VASSLQSSAKGSYVFASTGNVATGQFDKGGGFAQTATA
jgi:hypothetical protein